MGPGSPVHSLILLTAARGARPIKKGASGEPGNVNPPDEARLIGEAQRGSAVAFEDLVRRYDSGVLRLALRIVRSEEEAREIYQEAFLRTFRTIGEFRGECSFGTWLYRIVTNLCLDHTRRHRAGRRNAPLLALDGERGDRFAVGAARLLVDRRPESDPERVVESGEVRRRVGEALALLPERERLVFELRHDQGLRLAAIAEILETSDQTIRNCLYRAHQRLRAALADLRDIAARETPGGSSAGGRKARLAGRPEPVNGVE